MDQLKLASDRPIIYVLILSVTTLTFIVALAWNEAVQLYLKEYFLTEGNEVKANFIYSLVVTMILLVVSFFTAYAMKNLVF